MQVQDEAAPQVPLSELKGIDIEKGLKATANNEKLFRRLLGKFTENQKNFEEEFSHFIDKGDLQEAAKTAHTLKGLAANLGMTALQEAALGLEMACKENSGDTEVHFDLVLQQLDTVFDSLRQL